MVTKLTIEYEGTGFAGWARQPGKRTVEDELERALRTVLGESDADGDPLRLIVAGRTDRGVHAWGQVASYAREAVDPLRLNGLLDADVAVLAAEPAPPGFDARRDATSRTYCYRVLARRTRSVFERGRAFWWRGKLDREALAECAGALLGSHDFTAFTPTETEHSHFQRHVLRAEWRTQDDVLEFWIEADTFMRHMNRVLVGTMLDVGSGLCTVKDFRRLLAGGTRAQAGRTAPAHGLALAHVSYAGETGPPARAAGDASSRAAPGVGSAIGRPTAPMLDSEKCCRCS
jgi:tRNA pseudouridine38-40 synthase